jgi:ribonuclease P/MRP protein subunit POP5
MTVHPVGTIKQAQLAAITHNREVIARYRANRLTAGSCHFFIHCRAHMFILYICLAMYQDSYEEFLQKSTQELETLQD